MTDEEIQKRVTELTSYCTIDKVQVNKDSVEDFLYYLTFQNVALGFEGPFITMTEKGNLRAMWKRPDGEGEDWAHRQEFRLEFLGMGKATLMWLPLKPRDKPIQ